MKKNFHIFVYKKTKIMAERKNKVASSIEASPDTSKISGSAKSKPYRVSDAPAMYLSDFEVAYERKPYYNDAISLLKKSKEGLRPKVALDFLELSGFTQDEFQETFKTTVKTIQNHVTKELTLDAPLSEKLLKAFALFDKGSEIFGSVKVFSQWLRKPAYGLGYQVPLEMMDTITGIQLVEDELIRIEFGALA